MRRSSTAVPSPPAACCWPAACATPCPTRRASRSSGAGRHSPARTATAGSIETGGSASSARPPLRTGSDDLVVLADGELAPEDRDALRAAGVPTTEQPVAAVAPGLVRFADGDELA